MRTVSETFELSFEVFYVRVNEFCKGQVYAGTLPKDTNSIFERPPAVVRDAARGQLAWCFAEFLVWEDV